MREREPQLTRAPSNVASLHTVLDGALVELGLPQDETEDLAAELCSRIGPWVKHTHKRIVHNKRYDERTRA